MSSNPWPASVSSTAFSIARYAMNMSSPRFGSATRRSCASAGELDPVRARDFASTLDRPYRRCSTSQRIVSFPGRPRPSPFQYLEATMTYAHVVDVAAPVAMYDALHAEIVRQSGGIVDGLLAHVGHPSPTGFRVIEVWQSRAHFERYND